MAALAILMAEDILYGEIPNLSNYKHVVKFYRKELEEMYPELFFFAIKKIEHNKCYYEILPKPKGSGDDETG